MDERRKVISSPIGSIRVNDPNPNYKRQVLTIDDPTDQEPEQESIDDFRRYKQETQAAKAKAPVKAVNRLEFLIGLGRKFAEVNIEDQVFHLRTLKSNETRNVLKLSSVMSGFDQIFLLRSTTLAYSLFKINNDSIERILESDDFDNKIAFIEELDESIVSKLYEEYRKLQSSGSEDLGSTPEEVADNLKK